MAGYGVRLWLFCQTLGQLEERYPKSWKSIVENMEARFYFDTRGETAGLLSEQLGKKTVAYEATNTSVGDNTGRTGHQQNVSGNIGHSAGVQYTGRPLMTPEEVERVLGLRHQQDGPMKGLGMYQLNLIAGLPPFLSVRPHWFVDRMSIKMFNGRATALEEPLPYPDGTLVLEPPQVLESGAKPPQHPNDKPPPHPDAQMIWPSEWKP
jgi:hypothetical protein